MLVHSLLVLIQGPPSEDGAGLARALVRSLAGEVGREEESRARCKQKRSDFFLVDVGMGAII